MSAQPHFIVAQDAVRLEWVKRIGGLGDETIYSIQTDSSGNAYCTGSFAGMLAFERNSQVPNLKSMGDNDIFLAKLDRNGKLQWAKAIGGIGPDEALSLALDAKGEVYITGYFSEIVDFDPGAESSILTSVGVEDVFIAKFDAFGVFEWVHHLSGSRGSVSSAIALDHNGNIYTAGTYSGILYAESGKGMDSLVAAGKSTDVFVSKLNASGHLVWAKSIGGMGDDQGIALRSDAQGSVYVEGTFFGAVDLDPGAGVCNLSGSGAEDVFITKWDTNGSFLWGSRIGGAGSAFGYAMALDTSGNVYTSGVFTGTLVADTKPVSTAITALGGTQDGFVAKLNSDGSCAWIKRLGGSTVDDFVNAIAVDDREQLWIAGSFNETQDTNATGSDVSFAKLKPDGECDWIKQIGGTGNDMANAFTWDTFGHLWVTGIFRGVIRFGSDKSSKLSTAGGSDIFVVQYSY